MEKLKVSNGIYWVEVPEADLRILCGCPADSVKHLMKRGLIAQRQKAGVGYETGPNAILLCDSPTQKGCFTNLSEFPVLQMLYRQGMMIPGHPNNTGRKPMLIGLEDQVRSQAQYIFRGNYGLASEEEIMACGVPAETAHEMMRIKRWFAFGRIRETEELLSMKIVDKDAIELAPGVFVHRKGMNRWEFLAGGESVEVDLSLGDGEEYAAPFDLGSHTLRREYFSVIHIGEGDGWDPAKPCMGSILCFQGRLYLIDAGPNILHALMALGISVNEIEGIFHTHCHDDHFAGLTSLVRSDRRLRYFAAPYVRASVEKKLTALMGIDQRRFARLFDVHDLVPGEWNAVEGLDVRPVFAPHPVETTVLFFRAQDEKGVRTYTHLADLASLDVLEQMATDDPNKDGISRAARDQFKREMLEPLDLKKVDVGGGRIHGKPEDFSTDTSRKIIMSHSAVPFTEAQKEIGSSAAFGQSDVLIPVQHQTYILRSAHYYLKSYFPDVSRYEREMLINCSIAAFNAGSLMIRKGERNNDIFLILSGTAEVIDREAGFHSRQAAGALAGELSALSNEPSHRTFRAESDLAALRIPCETYRQFIRRNGIEESVLKIRENRQLLFNTRLFGDMVSFTAQREIARVMERRQVAKGKYAPHDSELSLYLLAEGEISLSTDEIPIEVVSPGDYWGEISVVEGLPTVCQALALRDSVYFAIPADSLKEFPSVFLKLLEVFDRRLKILRTKFHFEWQDFYSVGIPDIDDEHKKIFSLVSGLSASAASPEGAGTRHTRSAELLDYVRSHVDKEEALLESRGYPRLAAQREDHKILLADLEELVKTGESGDALLKDWLIRHTLIEDRLYKDFLVGPAAGKKKRRG
jgi:hemerythrin